MGRRDEADAARVRLARLGVELGAELRGTSPVDGLVDGPVARRLDHDEPPSARPLSAPGRHTRDRRARRGLGWLSTRLVDRVPDALRGRVALSPQHGTVVLAVVGIALALAGWLALRSGAHDEVVPRAELVSNGGLPTMSGGAGPSVSEPGSSVPGSSTSARPGSTGPAVVVDVSGKVRRPGIVTLPAGSRVHDAVRRAGGPREGVSLASLNLARVLVDGEQIVVGRAAPAGIAPAAVGSSPAAGAMVHLNAAGLAELDTLPGVGPVTAQKILDWRSAHGAFSSVDELLEVDGIGDKTLADIAPHVTL